MTAMKPQRVGASSAPPSGVLWVWLSAMQSAFPDTFARQQRPGGGLLRLSLRRPLAEGGLAAVDLHPRHELRRVIGPLAGNLDVLRQGSPLPLRPFLQCRL